MKNWKDTGQRSGFYREVDETCRCRRNCSGEIFGRLRNNCREVINPTQLALWCAKTAEKNVKTELAQAGCNLARVVVNVGSVREGGIVHAARLPGVPSSFRTVNYTLTPAIILVHTSPMHSSKWNTRISDFDAQFIKFLWWLFCLLVLLNFAFFMY